MADENQQSQDQNTKQEDLSMEELEKATAPAGSTEEVKGGAATDTTTPAAPVAAPTPAPTQAPTATPTPAPTPAPAAKPNLADQLKSAAKPAAPAPAPKATVTPVKAAGVAEPSTNEVVGRAQTEASTVGKIALQNILDYMKVMAPRAPIVPALGARHQVALYRAIVRIINNLDDDFALVFTAVLRLFAENAGSNGVFGEEHVFRFMDNVALTQDEIKSFQRLLNLLINTADVKGRAAGLKITDFNKTLEYGITDEGRARLLTYFNK